MRVKRRDGAVLRRLRTLYNIGTVGDLTDGQLLERFATRCRRAGRAGLRGAGGAAPGDGLASLLAILRDEHLAEDAVQATFLVLGAEARSLWVATCWAVAASGRLPHCVLSAGDGQPPARA